MRSIQSVLLCAVATCGSGALALSRIKVDPLSGMFVDEQSRVRIFHGVNAVEKIAPFYPQREGFDPVHSLSSIDAANLASWGFNVVRLGVLWQATVPHAGVIDHDYLSNISAIIDTLAVRRSEFPLARARLHRHSHICLSRRRRARAVMTAGTSL
jgi:hypothetical protein